MTQTRKLIKINECEINYRNYHPTINKIMVVLHGYKSTKYRVTRSHF